MINHYLILCVLVKICTAVPDDNTAKVELCATPNNEQGKCIVISKCQSLFNLLKAKPITNETITYLRRSHCGFNKSEPKVCCLLDDKFNGSLLEEHKNPTKADAVLPSLDVCGKFSEDRIISGSASQLDGYAWNALLEYQKPNGNGFHCGGVLISKQYVLTAAHCILDIPTDWNLFSVRLGEHDPAQNPDCEHFQEFTDCADPVVDVHVDKKIVHDSYKINDVNHDIALIRLGKPITFSDFIRPICLPPANFQEKITSFRVAGWGANHNSEVRGVKQYSTISAETKTDCPFSKNEEMRSDQLCIVATQKYQNMCYVDSGGALLSTVPDYSRLGNYYAIGVSAIPPSVCDREKPMLFTKVSSYIHWIVEHMEL